MTDRIVRLAILDSYGVRWTRETFARDLLQNFFDAAPDFRAVDIDVRPGSRRVEIRGPASFDIDLLAYVGATTKTDGRTAGGFGEGFKVCALIGVRDFGLTMSAGTGKQELSVLLDPVPLGRELCYRVGPRRRARQAGSFVRLEGCDDACLAAFQAAPAMFRHPHNPKLGTPIVEDAAQGVAVYPSPDPRAGEIYYRRQLRGRASFYGSGPTGSVTLAHDGVIEAIEGDRDRRDLPPRPIARAIGDKLTQEELGKVLMHLVPYWKYGSDVLAGLMEAAIARGLRYTWPPRWMARAARAGGLNDFAERQGYQIALAAFAELGMPTPGDHYTNLETRPATPLERARIQVLCDLYAELNGKPAKVNEFEVFDRKGAAVLGQHLGDKVIVQAQIIEEGFDALAGTVLHELSHETGGEEDIRFLNRLTTLITSAIRAPETIAAARAAYGTAAPKEEPAALAGPAEPTAMYAPETKPYDSTEGVICTLVTPPAYPPNERLIAELCAAAEAVGISIWVVARTVTGPVEAVRWRAAGVPTLWIGDLDPEPPPPGTATATLGYHVRTYDAEGTRLFPDREAMQRALVEAKARGFTGQKGLRRSMALDEGARERVQQVLGVTLPERGARVTTDRQERIERLEAWARSHADHGGFGLAARWNRGREVAGLCVAARYADDPRRAQEIWPEVVARVDEASACADALRDADPDFDDADALERDAMKAAMGAAIQEHAQETDPAVAGARAEAAFRAVREATARALDLDVALDVKMPILEHALAGAGLPPFLVKKVRFDHAAFARAMDQAASVAVRLQRRVDEEGGFLMEHDLKKALSAEDPEQAELEARMHQTSARMIRETHAIKAAYDRALAATGSEIEAARRCIEEAARVRPEVRP